MNIFKNRLFLVILTAIICISGSVYATTKYLASEIEYKETTVEGALNDLYTVHETYKNLTSDTTVTSDKLLNGITAYDNNGNLITGTNTDNCTSGLINVNSSISTINGQKLFDFIPSKFILHIRYPELSNPTRDESSIFYIPEEYGNVYYQSDLALHREDISNFFTQKDGKLYANNWIITSGKIYYFACR